MTADTPTYLGWWLPVGSHRWVKLVEAATYGEAFKKLLDAMKEKGLGGGALVLRAGEEP